MMFHSLTVCDNIGLPSAETWFRNTFLLFSQNWEDCSYEVSELQRRYPMLLSIILVESEAKIGRWISTKRIRHSIFALHVSANVLYAA